MKRTLRPITFLTPLVLVASLAQAHERPALDAYYGSGGAGARRAPASKLVKSSARPFAAARKAAVIASVDAKRGVPSFLWARKDAPEARSGGATPEAAARAYLERYASLYNVSRADVAAARVEQVHDLGRGPVVVSLRQRVGGVEVFRSDVKMLLGRADRELLAISGAPHAAAAPAARAGGFELGGEDALASAFGDMFGVSVGAGAFRDAGRAQGAYRYFDVSPDAARLGAASLLDAPRLKQVYFPLPGRLVPAYYLELAARQGADGKQEGYAYVVSAVDGSLLYRASLVAHDAFTYKVFADNDPAHFYPPTDGPVADTTPFPGTPGQDIRPAPVDQIAVSLEGFNRSPAGTPDPWLPPEATRTSGNNVNAYADHDETTDPATGAPIDNGQTGTDPTAETTGPKAFEYTYDPNLEPAANATQTKAAITQLFYLNNWLHDYWYDSGFNEAAGVAQNSNFGRVLDATGAVDASGENDAIEAEAQDKLLVGARDNANMFTPLDGAKPRMQMFLWNGRFISGSVTTTAPGQGTIAEFTGASFGPTKFNVTAPAALAVDATAPPNDACTAVDSAVSGRVAIIDRGGGCGFAVKALNAQVAGAVGVVIVNNNPDPPIPMGGVPTSPITIPSVMVSQATGAALKAALAGGFNVTLQRVAERDYDGTIDNTIAAHEWGHYWHHRLVLCGSQVCGAMSEGWGDLAALMLTVRPGDNLDGSFATAAFAGSAEPGAAYYGIRRYPYSTQRTVNPLTYGHMAVEKPLPTDVPINPLWTDAEGNPTLHNSEVHNGGEVWASMLFDAYVAMLKAGGNDQFDAVKRRMADYLVGGMKLAPVEPTFVEQRNAILAYVYNANEADYEHFVKAFVDRGMGVGAVSPPIAGGELLDPADPTSDQTFNELVENFDRKGELAFADAVYAENVRSCDGDGVVDAQEVGEVVLKLDNVGMDPVDAANVQVTTEAPGVTFPNGPTATSASVDPYGTLTVRIAAQLPADVAQQGEVTFNVTVNSASTFTATLNTSIASTTNYDEQEKASAVDTVETKITPWTAGVNVVEGSDGEAIWGRTTDAAGNALWHGDDAGFASDASLESPAIAVDATAKFVLSFDHRFSFETGPAVADGPDVFWDGGVLEFAEVTGEGGQGEWQDVTKLAGVNPGYTGKIGFPDGGNPLVDRPGFIGETEGFAEGKMVPASINFGTTLAGKTVRFRFRIGTDAFTGAAGWDVDNIKVEGATNTPFPAIVADASDCAGVPVANAGDDQTVNGGAAVTLDASKSSDPTGEALTYAWEQLEGPAATLASGENAKPTFTAPNVTEDTALVFRVRASDPGKAFGTDTVKVTVLAPVGTGGSGGAAGSGAGGSNNAGGGTAGGINNPGDGDDDGCGCSTVGSPEVTRGAWLSALAAGLAFVRRRRRQNG